MGISLDWDILEPPATPPRYTSGVTDDAIGMTGGASDLNDETTADDPVVGSGPELGGQESTATTYGSNGVASGVTDEDTVNLTGMSESPMTANASGPNVNGSGAPSAQQVSSRAPSGIGTQIATSDIVSGISKFGSSIADSLFAPRKSNAPMVLMQTKQAGLGKWGNLALFFMIGLLIAMVVVD